MSTSNVMSHLRYALNVIDHEVYSKARDHILVSVSKKVKTRFVHVRGSFIKFQDWGCNAYIISPTFLICTTMITYHVSNDPVKYQ